ncbi:hypothetical protein DLM75_23320 [Leptospira stimsonii]|uniref:Uncharacterized protein n=1 Tax=Leptospira stimsonii TaxID=2202203 RepID=A0A396YR47_9LEPT|nr:hypothetical protein DLM75_23320 [Leptospira stimsonii]
MIGVILATEFFFFLKFLNFALLFRVRSTQRVFLGGISFSNGSRFLEGFLGEFYDRPLRIFRKIVLHDPAFLFSEFLERISILPFEENF